LTAIICIAQYPDAETTSVTNLTTEENSDDEEMTED